MWLVWSLVGLGCAVFYGLSITYTKVAFGLHPFGFVTLWVPGIAIGLIAMLWIAHAKGAYSFPQMQGKFLLVLILLPIAGITIGVLMNISTPYAIAYAPNPGYVFAILSCGAPIISFLSIRFGFNADELTLANKCGLAALPFVVLMATYKS